MRNRTTIQVTKETLKKLNEHKYKKGYTTLEEMLLDLLKKRRGSTRE